MRRAMLTSVGDGRRAAVTAANTQAVRAQALGLAESYRVMKAFLLRALRPKRSVQGVVAQVDETIAVEVGRRAGVLRWKNNLGA